MKDLLKLRKSIKAKKPKFTRQDSHKRIEVPERWRKPRGRQSKMKKGFAGHRATPNPGFGSPRAVRGMHKSGLIPIIVNNVAELSAINIKTQGAVFSGKLGVRKTGALLTKAKELGVNVLNVKDIDAKLKQIQDDLAARKEAKKKRTEKKEAKTKEKEKTAKKKEEKEKTEEEQKEKEKKDLDKALITRTQ